jgi:hypothetical protein
MKKLILQISGSGADDNRTARKQQGYEVRKGLARAGASLSDQRLAIHHDLTDSLGQRTLALANREAWDFPRKLAVRFERVGQSLEVVR